MKKIFCLFILISFNALGDTVSLPPAVSGIDDIVNEFRNTLVLKINELGKNFISNVADKTIVFTSSSELGCNGKTMPAGDAVSNMIYSFNRSEGELSERATYTGCNHQVTLIEDVITRGDKLETLKFDDFIKGKRSFELKPNENYRLYRVMNSDHEEIAKVLIDKKGNTQTVEFSAVGQKVLRMDYEYLENSTRLTLTFFGYSAKYVRKYSTWKFNDNSDISRISVFVNRDKFNQVTYLNTHGQLISQADYVESFDNKISSGIMKSLRAIFEYHNYYFPETKSVQTGTMNSQFKEELRLMFNRVQNNAEKNSVLKQIQDYMDAAEKELIIDNRPR